jgi:hypothetical protein
MIEKIGAVKVYAKTNMCQLLLKLKFPKNARASKANNADRSSPRMTVNESAKEPKFLILEVSFVIVVSRNKLLRDDLGFLGER